MAGPRRDRALTDVERRVSASMLGFGEPEEPDRVPELAPTQSVTIGSEDAFNAAIRDPRALESLRQAVAAENESDKQKAIRVFETTNEGRSFKDLLDVEKTAEGAKEAFTSPTGKFITRTIGETAGGVAAAGGHPIGAVRPLTRTVGKNVIKRAGERVVRGVQRAAPNMWKVGLGEGVTSLLMEGIDPTLDPESGEFDLRAAIERAAITGTTGALFESIVPGVNDGLEFLRKGGFKLVDEAAEPVVEKILEEGAAAAPGFFANSRILQLMDNIAAGSFFGFGSGKRVKRKGAEIFNKEAEDFIDAYRTAASGSIAVEQLASDLLTGGVDAWKLTGKKMYGVIDELTGGGYKVDLNPIIRELETARSKFGGQGAKQILDDIENMRKHGRVSELNTVSFEDAHEIRSDLLALSRGGGDELVAGKKQALGKRLSPLISAEMDKAFKLVSGKPGLIEEVPGELIKRKHAADAFWKAGSETFNTSLVRQLAADGPTGLINAARKSPGSMRVIRETIESIDTPVRTATGEVLTGEQVWKNVQGQLLFEESNKVLGKTSGTVTEGLIEGQGMVNRLAAQPELFTEAFGKEGYQNLLDFFESAAFAQGKGAQRELPGRLFIQFAQAGALGALPAAVFFGVGDPAEAGVRAAFVLAAPAWGAAMLANPKFTRFLLRGTDKNISYTKRTRALVQAAAMAQREGFVIADASQRRKDSESEVPFGTSRPLPALPAHLSGP
jgi:hypothetical protein